MLIKVHYQINTPVQISKLFLLKKAEAPYFFSTNRDYLLEYLPNLHYVYSSTFEIVTF